MCLKSGSLERKSKKAMARQGSRVRVSRAAVTWEGVRVLERVRKLGF